MGPSISLRHVTAVILALGLQACCNVDDQTVSHRYEEVIEGEVLDEIRMENDNDDDRCAAACESIAEDDGVELDTLESCDAVGADDDADTPWADSHVAVTVTCRGTSAEMVYCTGRRPQGHHESSETVDSVGAWFALHAHLEAASVTAFTELALWLDRRAAPASLVTRCRAAAEDEVVHAGMMGLLASVRGSTIEPCVSDPPSDDILAVARHNAVEGCVHEAFAASIAAVQAERAHDPAIRDTFARIASDELRHGQLAWDLHAWFLGQLDETDRAEVVDAQRQAFTRLGETARENARGTPAELGWPTTAAAQLMAQAFADQAARELCN